MTISARLFLVSYKIDNEQVRSGFEKYLQDTVHAWWHHVPSTWLVLTDEDPTSITRWLKHFLGGPDRLLIFELPANHTTFWGWLPPDGWAWLNDPAKRVKPPKEEVKVDEPKKP